MFALASSNTRFKFSWMLRTCSSSTKWTGTLESPRSIISRASCQPVYP